jgi:hypothetical protein
VPQLPLSAMASVAVDHVLPTAEIARTIVRLATTPELEDRDVPPEETKPDPAEFLADALRTKALPGSPSVEKQALEGAEQIGVLRGVLVEARNDAERGGNGSRSGSARGKRRSGVRRSAGARPARRAVSDRGRDG